MRPRLATADFTFPMLPHDRALDLIAALGFQGVDIGLFAGRSHVRPEQAFNDLTASARDLSDRVRSRGLEFADIFVQAATDFAALAPNHPDAAVRQASRDAFSRGLELVVRCNARHLTVLPGALFDGEGPGDSLARCADELAWRVAQSQALGVTLAVEAHVGSVVPTPALATELIERCPGLTLTLDYCHFTSRGTPDAAIEPLLAHASHFHARGAHAGRVQASVKANTIDYDRVVRQMRATRYAGWIGIEYVWSEWEHCNEVDNLSETILLRDKLTDAIAAEAWS
jgi:sugar phosphate isomerase/epimerase